jgi:hypothetical protein
LAQFQGRPELLGQGGNKVLNSNDQETPFPFDGKVVLAIWTGKKSPCMI